MAKRVSVHDLRTAAAWLYENEGDDGEADACHRVADWLAAEIDRRDLGNVAREVSRHTGRKVSASKVRAFLDKKSTPTDRAA